MVQAQLTPPQANGGQTNFTTAKNPTPTPTTIALSSPKDAAFARLWAAVGIADPEERLAALESIAEAVQLAANAKARATWRGYSLWRAPLDGRTRILGLLTPDCKRYRMRKSMVSDVWLWEGNPFMGYLNALNLQLRRAGSSVQVQSKHVLITWYLREAEKRVEAGIEAATGVCPLCGGELVLDNVWVGGKGWRTETRCWHEEQGCNDWLVRRGRL